MSKSTRNTGTPWTRTDVQDLRHYANGNTPTRVIGFKMGRTPAAVQKKASDEGISLAPPNQRPYGTKK